MAKPQKSPARANETDTVPAIDLSDIEAIEREAERHAQPTPLLVRAMCAVVRELRLQRLGPGERRG